jgi:hypothetical protein
MKIGMTGTRNDITEMAQKTLINFLNNNKINEVHHGDCVGADNTFHNICLAFNIKIIIHPPDDNKMRSFCKSDTILPTKKYIKRNHDIVDVSDMLIAFPPTKEELLRSGTWSTIRYAKKKNKKIFIIFPDGTTEE